MYLLRFSSFMPMHLHRVPVLFIFHIKFATFTPLSIFTTTIIDIDPRHEGESAHSALASGKPAHL